MRKVVEQMDKTHKQAWDWMYLDKSDELQVVVRLAQFRAKSTAARPALSDISDILCEKKITSARSKYSEIPPALV